MKAIATYGLKMLNEIESMSTTIFVEDDQSLHRLRILNKKLKAFIHLLEFCDQSQAVSASKEFRKLYKSISVIRDLQVVRIKFVDKDPAGRNRIIESEKKAMIRFQKKYNRSGEEITNELKSFFLKQKEVVISPEQVLAYFRNLSARIKENILNLALTSEEFHALRKMSKDFMYNLALLDKAEQIQLPAFLSSAELDEIQHLIGDWHDHFIAGKILKKHKIKYAKAASKNKKKLLSEIKKMIAEKQHLLL